MGEKSKRELELIVQRLNSQLESKNAQIAELNEFIRNATDNTQELIRNFRAFCVKVLESELAYGDISSRDLESMSLNDLLSRAKKMLQQNQEKAREIYDMFKGRLDQKNQNIQGLTDQITQLKSMLDNAEKLFGTPYQPPEDAKRAPAYMLDTNTPLEALKPAMAMTTVAGENERVVDFEGATDKEAVNIVSKGKMFIQNIESILEKMKDIHWKTFQIIVETGVSESGEAKNVVFKKMQEDGDNISPEKVARAIKHLTTLMLFTQIKVNTGIRWFTVLKLTDTGRSIYIDKYKKQPTDTEYMKIVREHENAEHGYMIKDVVSILEDTGKYRSVSMSRRSNMIAMGNGKSCIPDVVCCGKNSVEYYEVECGNHHQSDFNDKCNKLKSITPNLYFITSNKDVAEKRLKPQIEQWIKSCGLQALRYAGITVYLTSISDFAMQKWTYVFDMRSEKGICIEESNNNESEEKTSDELS